MAKTSLQHFKAVKVLLESTIQTQKKNFFRRFFLTAVVLGSMLQKGGRIKGADVRAAAALTRKETESDDVISLLKEGIMSRGSVQK